MLGVDLYVLFIKFVQHIYLLPVAYHIYKTSTTSNGKQKGGEDERFSFEVWRASHTGWVEAFLTLAAKLLKDSITLNACQHVKVCSHKSHQVLVKAPKLKTNWQYLPLKCLVHLKNWHFWICGLSCFAVLMLFWWSFLNVQYIIWYVACSVRMICKKFSLQLTRMEIISSHFHVNIIYNMSKQYNKHLANAFDSSTNHYFNGQLGRN